MRVSIGTFNVNNLFSRWNFQGEVDAFRDGDTELTTTITFQLTQPDRFRLRTFRGRLVKGKPAEERAKIARRIIAMNVDVLALQEVEDIDTLRRFVSEDLGRHYPHLVLVEGNDPRLIDVALLSKLPIGAVVSWQHATHRDVPNKPVFGRDLLEVEILNPTRREKLFTIFNNHLKSHFVPFDEDPELGAERNNERRRRQAETVAKIVAGPDPPEQSLRGAGRHERPAGHKSARAVRRRFRAAPAQCAGRSRGDAPGQGRHAAAGFEGLDPPLQTGGPARRIRAVRSDLAEPGAGRARRPRRDRPPHQARRRRQRP